MPRPQTYDHLKSQKKPLEVKVPIYLDGAPIETFENAREELERAKTRRLALRDQAERAAALAGPGQVLTRTPALEEAEEAVARLEQEVETAKAAVEEATTWFLIRKPTPKGRKRYEDLIKAHPPTEEQVAEAKKDGQEMPPYDSETFAPALFSLCCAEPVMSIEDATDVFDDWSITECTEIFAACMAVCTGRRTVDLGNG